MMIDQISNLGQRASVIADVDRTGSTVKSGNVTGTGGVDFEQSLSEAILGVAEKLRHAEAVSISGIKGMASTQEVVEKVMAAEQSLQAAIAVRDKVVSAYLEVSRMAI
jgi:flagellar hook-basal body complex protein FliE